MNSVIKCENFRYKKSKEIKIIAILQIALIVLQTAFILSVQNISFLKNLFGDSLMINTTPQSFFASFPRACEGMLFRPLMVIMIASLIVKLYQSGVIKQLVSSGIKRNNVILGQFVSLTIAFSFICFVIAVVQGISNLIFGGSFSLDEGNYARLLLAMVGVVLVIANRAALYMIMAHLTGSMGASIAVGLAIETGAELVIMYLGTLFKTDVISKYYFGTLQEEAIAMTGSVSHQLISMALLCAYTVVFLLICQVVFAKKDVK